MNRTLGRFSGYAFVLPYLILFTTFLLFPLFYGLGLSFTQYEMASTAPARFVGLANYREAFDDPAFKRALGVTVMFVAMCVPLTIGLALVLATGLEQLGERSQKFFRLGLFVPTMITISVAGILWRWFYDSDFGIFNAYLGAKVPWLTDKSLALFSIVIMTVWWTVGAPMVILQAGLKQIPQAYYEAAAIDGAVGWRRFAFITLPLLRPVLLFVIVINVIGAFQIFGQPFIMTRGGPEQSTRVLVMYIYETAFNFYRMGYGSAMSWLLFLIIMVFSLIQFRVLRER
ncbi:MAG: sugar ABC transporter permease [Anaerolineae bacterium]|nr:sugar ABC transporter permease [Phycisphaerae bacterium]